VTDDRPAARSRVASVGWALKAKAGRKKVVLELGGNAAVIVDRDADLADATRRIVFGAFYQSGQSCIGVQRILIHEAVYEDLRARLVTATAALRMGDPKIPKLHRPMISRRKPGASRAGSLLRGWKLVGGKRQRPARGDARRRARGSGRRVSEAFGPVAKRFRDFDAALRQGTTAPTGSGRHLTRDLTRQQA
jgi:acyl-CoA reductase-like NAD-dependent aldehyde dehydrogenase